ncbi:MAG: hypothetical protein J6S06_00055 [Alphaproteobacteria bacterium]|nr:hypothetical protein [Alphaproteobacteria bacterium]
MNNTHAISLHAEKFQSAEQIWFWFLYSRAIRNSFVRQNNNTRRKICELVDVETLITKLYLAGRLNDEQLVVMKKYGDKRRAPHQYIWTENSDADKWKRAIEVLESACKERGWIEEQ